MRNEMNPINQHSNLFPVLIVKEFVKFVKFIIGLSVYTSHYVRKHCGIDYNRKNVHEINEK